MKSLTDPLGGLMQFEHDTFGNLTATTFGDGKTQLRNPDVVGNLFETNDRTDRKYDRGGRLLESKNATYKYDKEGNLIEKREKDGKVWQYEWNHAGMLAKVIRPDKNEVTFGYDALGRRIWKRYYNTITRWVWDGNKPLHEWKEHALTGDILSDTTVGADGVITWLFDEESFAPVAKLKGERKYSILTDHLGTPVQMFQEDGTMFWQGELDSYGRMRMERGEAGSCPFRYQGQYQDRETGLYYNRFRYYAPEEGMYISQDPTGLLGGYRVYGYVKDTNGLIDPSGLTAYNPKWKSTQTGDTAKNSAILRKKLGITDPKIDAHHIVHSTHKRAQKTRNILDKYQIDINDKANGVGLVGGKGAPKNVLPRHHRGGGLHSHKGIDAVNKRIQDAQDGITDWAQGRQAVLSELQLIRTEIVNGLFP